MADSAEKSTISAFNAMEMREATALMVRCCGAKAWCENMASARPVISLATLKIITEKCFDALTENDWLEAFAAHPKIGDLQSLRMKFAGNRQWSGGEQAGVNTADETTLQRLAAGNAAYENRFGFIFIVCATGKSASQMLALLETRLHNPREKEITIAAGEQRKITRLRLEKMFS